MGSTSLGGAVWVVRSILGSLYVAEKLAHARVIAGRCHSRLEDVWWLAMRLMRLYGHIADIGFAI